MSTTEAANTGAAAPVRCQRIGCDATFTEDNNPEGSCQYHPSGEASRIATPSVESAPGADNLRLRNDAETGRSAYNLRLRKEDLVATQRRIKFARSREEQNERRKRRKEAETLKQKKLNDFIEESWSSIQNMIAKLPDRKDDDFENRTVIRTADASAATGSKGWRPYFSSPDIGVFKTTLKGASWEVERLALQAAPSVVGLQSRVGETDHFFCSGTVVKSDKETHTIVTVANLVKCPDLDEVVGDLTINVYLHSNETCAGNLVYHDFYHNICLIQIDSPVHLLAKSFSPNIDSFDFGKSCSRNVVTLGREKDTHTFVVSTGRVIPKCSKFDCEELVVSTCRISKEEVGGPLMNFDGDLIGMNYYDANETPFIPSLIVLKFLHQYTSLRKVVRPSLGLQVRTLYAEGCDAFEKMQINFSGATCVIIEKIEEQSPAKASGLNEGDVINRVNGVYFSNAIELGAMLLDIGAMYLSRQPIPEQLDDSNKMAIQIKFGVMGCEHEKTVVVDKFASGGSNRWPFPKPIIVEKYWKGKKVHEDWYTTESRH